MEEEKESSMIDLREIGLKAQSKVEFYRLITLDVQLFIPPIEEVNMEYLSLVL
jgi:hypothetical protein